MRPARWAALAWQNGSGPRAWTPSFKGMKRPQAAPTRPARRSHAGNFATTLHCARCCDIADRRGRRHRGEVNLQYRAHAGGTGSEAVWWEPSRGQPRCVPRRGGLSGRIVDARAPLQALSRLCCHQTPVGAGTSRTDWHRHRANWAAVTDRCEVGCLYGSIR